MLGATETTRYPEVAAEGMVKLIDMLLHELIVMAALFSITRLLPCEAPNPVPEIVTSLPTLPVVAETLEITGAGAADEFTETLSKVAVDNDDVLWLATPRPTYTSCVMLMVSLDPNCIQVTPSGATYAVTLVPLRTNCNQYGAAVPPP
jgi:hypothetical protein